MPPNSPDFGYSQADAYRARLKRHRNSRTGAVLLLVIGTTLILSLLALASLRASKSQGQVLQWKRAGLQAADLAISAVEQGRHELQSTTNWRAQYADAAWTDPTSVDGGTMSWKVVDALTQKSIYDPETNITEDLRPIRIFGRGRIGFVEHRSSVEMRIERVPIDAVRHVLACAGDLELIGGPSSNLQSDGWILAAGSLTNTISISANVRAGQVINAGSIQGQVEQLSGQVSFPPERTFFHYRSLATIVPWNEDYFVFCADDSCFRLRTNVLYQSIQQFNPPIENPRSIFYVAIPGGVGTVEINYLRMSATWIIDVQGPGTTVKLGEKILWTPPSPDVPTAIIRNAETVIVDASSRQDLVEGTDPNKAGTANYNPVGFPYFGDADGDSVDSYPSQIEGIVHILGGQNGQPTLVRLGRRLRFHGSLIAPGRVELQGPISEPAFLTMNEQRSLESSPPFGYYDLKFSPSRGSWRQEFADAE